MDVTNENEYLTVHVKQQMVLKKGLVNSDEEQMIACHKIKTAEWYCYWSTITYDGIEYILTNYVYSTTSIPDKANFTDNVAFDFATGFSTGYTKLFHIPGKATTKGMVSAPSTATLDNAAWTYDVTGNMLSTDSKTFDSSITFKQNYGTTANAASSKAIVKDGSGMVFQGVYTNIAATK